MSPIPRIAAVSGERVAPLSPKSYNTKRIPGHFLRSKLVAKRKQNYENVETFVERLVREDLLVSDPVVKAVLAGQPPEMSLRTVRRRFLLATGLTYKVIAQIERAKQAADLLEQGVSLLETAYQAGYADQSHMTRSLKHFIGHTPAQIAQSRKPK